MSYEQLLDKLSTEVANLQEELQSYREKGATVKAQAQRLRKKTSDLTHLMKEFRAASVEHHRR